MINLAYIISTLDRSGPVNVLYNIVKYIDKSKFKIFIFTLSQEKQTSRISDFIEIGCVIQKLSIKNYSILYSDLTEIDNLLSEKNISIVHAHCLRSTLLLSRLTNSTRSYKKIVTIHSNIAEDFRFAFGRVKGIFLESLFKKAVKKIPHRICCSKSVMEALTYRWKLDLSYICNGVDLGLYKYQDETDKNNIRNKLGLDCEKTYFISVGALSKRKDPLFIIKSFLKLNLENYYLLFLGNGPEFSKLQRYASDKIRFLGNVHNVQDFLYCSDYFISASNSEGLPNSVIEALAMKLPVLLSDIPAHREILEMNTDAGVLFKKSTDAFNLTMEEILKTPYDSLKKNAYEIVLQNLNAEKMALSYQKKYLDIYSW